MTLEAGFRLPLRLQGGLARNRSHDRVTVGTCDGSSFVDTAVPVGAIATLMAGETNCVVVLDPAGGVVLAEGNNPTHTASVGRHGRSDQDGIRPGRGVLCAARLRRTQASVVARDVFNRALIKKRNESI